jgi:hypothetical protein
MKGGKTPAGPVDSSATYWTRLRVYIEAIENVLEHDQHWLAQGNHRLIRRIRYHSLRLFRQGAACQQRGGNQIDIGAGRLPSDRRSVRDP